jgi:hypothetical protein
VVDKQTIKIGTSYLGSLDERNFYAHCPSIIKSLFSYNVFGFG